ncbi:MAG: 3-hydroxyacyl-[acyl-carrier-protein] dehydratase FabZ [Gemmatimonadetes bacterium]|nr:3-hydroxyacyl-[acyl-carrier-protein] dehydratase FabZ [Gemmatimonadota bacterium]MDP7361793.1 3-hydroxyacyl-ACP dehydratase FabZ [Candidatus Latescibacterota bacterium]
MSDLPDDADEAATETVLDIVAIKKIIPHRYPLLLVDRIIEMVPGERVVGLKSVTGNEPFFEGHFPDYPVMPGVLIIEALAQTGAVMMLQESEVQIPFLAGIDKARFRRQVVPGDQLRLELVVLRARAGTCKMTAKAFVDGELAAEAEIMAVAR